MSQNYGRRSRSGFTVIECLAGIAVLSSVGVVVGPLGSSIMANNFDTQSQMMHHRLARYQMMYMADNDGAFTGANTSGLAWNREFISGAGDGSQYSLEFETDSSNPTLIGDWISPLVGDAMGFSPNRAMRRAQVLELVGDPTATERVDVLYTNAGSPPGDLNQFASLQKKGAYRQQSFLQLRSFTHFSSEHRRGEVLFQDSGDIVYQHYATQFSNDVAMSPAGYTPRVWNVGTQVSNKIMFADGTRFYTDDEGLSMGVDPMGSIFTEDASSGAIDHGSVAYGRDNSSSRSQHNLDLSFRKEAGQGMYTTMFDGSIRFMTREEAWTDPTPWYPSGSSWQGSGATPESQAWVKQNLLDGVIP